MQQHAVADIATQAIDDGGTSGAPDMNTADGEAAQETELPAVAEEDATQDDGEET